jgi:hypothetical protein
VDHSNAGLLRKIDMANGNGFIQRAPLPPLNSPVITEGDRARVYGLIGRELNSILNGANSYHLDGVKKSSKDLMSELNGLITSVERLKNAVNDPENIVGDAARYLHSFGKRFETGVSNDIETMWNDPRDERDMGIRLPDHLAPITEDHNIIHVDPESDGQFSTPNPLAPDQWRRDLKASIEWPNDKTASAADSYPQLARRVTRFAPGTNPIIRNNFRHRLNPAGRLGF